MSDKNVMGVVVFICEMINIWLMGTVAFLCLFTDDYLAAVGFGLAMGWAWFSYKWRQLCYLKDAKKKETIL